MPVKSVWIEKQLYSHLFKQTPDHLKVRYVSNRLAHAFGDDAYGIIGAFQAKGWNIDDLYLLDMTSREWRKNPLRILQFQDGLMGAGCDSETARRLSCEPILYGEENFEKILHAVKEFMACGLLPDQIRRIVGRRPEVMLHDPMVIRIWSESLAAEGKDRMEYVSFLPRLSRQIRQTPVPQTRVNWLLTAIPHEQAPQSDRPKKPCASNAPPTESQQRLVQTDESEPALPHGGESSSDEILPPAAQIEAVLPVPEIAPPNFAVLTPLKTIPWIPPNSAVVTPNVSARKPNPVAERPDVEMNTRVNWAETAKTILESRSNWNDTHWQRFRKDNPWIDLTDSSEVRILDLLKHWFDFPNTAQPGNSHLRFLMCFLLGRNLPQEPKLRRLRIQLSVLKRSNGIKTKREAKNRAKEIAAIEKRVSVMEEQARGLRELLKHPPETVFLRLYALRRIIQFPRLLKHPEAMILPFEQVQPESKVLTRGFSIPPPGEFDAAKLQAIGQELRFRANHIESFNPEAKPWRKPYLNILLEPTRTRFLQRLEAYIRRQRKAASSGWSGTHRSSNPYSPIP